MQINYPSGMKVFFTYVDWTLEAPPRVFYVGKGNENRIKTRERNRDWKVISKELGWRREVVFVSLNEDAAYEAEKWLVQHHNTFRGWGANHNQGGWGSRTGWTHDSSNIELMREQKLGENNPMKRAAVKQHYLERRFSAVTLAKHAEKMNAPELRRKRCLQVVGEKNPRSKLTWEAVREIRKLHAEGMQRRELASRFGVLGPMIRLILINESWRE